MIEVSRPRITVETLLYVAIASLALAVRLWGLGAQPLTDAEAHDALLAIRFLRGEAEPSPTEAEPGPSSPLLFSLTSLAFLLFGASDATARLAPALAGAGLALSPIYLRRELGQAPGLAVAALLALSPTLIAASRTADGAMLAALAAMVGIGSVVEYSGTGQRRHLVTAAAGTGAFLACGPRALTSGLGLVIGLWLWRLLASEGVTARAARLRAAGTSRRSLAMPVAVGAAMLIAGSSALLLYKSGLSAAAQAVPDWVAGWQPGAASRGWLHLLGLLLVYEPLGLILGVAGLLDVVWRWAEKDRLAWGLAGWSVGALMVGLAYPARASVDVVWIVIPLAALAGLFLVRLFSGGWAELDVPAIGIHAVLVVVLLCYAALNLAGYGQAARSLSGNAAAYLGLGAVSLVLIALVSLLFGVGWSASGAVRGLGVGASLALLLASLSATSRLVSWGEQPEMPGELWYAGPPAPVSGLRMLVSTLEDVSAQAVGAPHDLEVVVDGPPEGELAWALRDFHATAYTDSLAASISSPAVIASADQATPELGSSYVGQSFAIRGSLDASSWGALDWLSWLIFRRAPNRTESVVLWVRSDVHFKTEQAQR